MIENEQLSVLWERFNILGERISTYSYSWLAPYLHFTSSPSMRRSTASEGRPINSSVFSHTLWAVSRLCASSEGLVGRQSWEMKAQVGQSSDFNSSQYSGTWGSVAAKRALLEPALAENYNIFYLLFCCFSFYSSTLIHRSNCVGKNTQAK